MEIGLVPSGNDPKYLLAAKRSPSNYMEASPLLSPLPAGRRAYLGAPDMLEPWVRRLAGLPIFCPLGPPASPTPLRGPPPAG